MRVYMGFRTGGMCHVYSWDAAHPGTPQKLDPRLDLWAHSPSGMEWGYEGSGPAQLALALAADALADGERAVAIHQAFKRALVSHLGRQVWSVTRDYVCEVINHLEEERSRKEVEEHGER